MQAPPHKGLHVGECSAVGIIKCAALTISCSHLKIPPAGTNTITTVMNHTTHKGPRSSPAHMQAVVGLSAAPRVKGMRVCLNTHMPTQPRSDCTNNALPPCLLSMTRVI
jgi:hypothetical protein